MKDSMQLTSEAIALIRSVMTDLRPAVLDDYGLEAALESYLDVFKNRYNLKVRFDHPDHPIPRLGPSVEMTFLRIGQEALMNVARHAQASEVVVSLQQRKDAVSLAVQDNGTGIESWQDANRPGSHGLTIMRERAEAFGGNLKVKSVPGQGTTVQVAIPIPDQSPAQKQEQS
jgi:two-component system sensor histidine kinase UhpB